MNVPFLAQCDDYFRDLYYSISRPTIQLTYLFHLSSSNTSTTHINALPRILDRGWSENAFRDMIFLFFLFDISKVLNLFPCQSFADTPHKKTLSEYLIFKLVQLTAFTADTYWFIQTWEKNWENTTSLFEEEKREATQKLAMDADPWEYIAGEPMCVRARTESWVFTVNRRIWSARWLRWKSAKGFSRGVVRWMRSQPAVRGASPQQYTVNPKHQIEEAVIFNVAITNISLWKQLMM